jgi:fumarylacetoacetase
LPQVNPSYRPKGQQLPVENEPPVFGASKQLDFELELAFTTYQGKPLGESITTKEADDFIYGMCLFNDWTAQRYSKMGICSTRTVSWLKTLPRLCHRGLFHWML